MLSLTRAVNRYEKRLDGLPRRRMRGGGGLASKWPSRHRTQQFDSRCIAQRPLVVHRTGFELCKRASSPLVLRQPGKEFQPRTKAAFVQSKTRAPVARAPAAAADVVFILGTGESMPARVAC